MSGLDAAKEEVCAVVDALADELLAVSHRIHAHPEPAWQERRASALLAEVLDHHGLRLELGAYGVPTSFVARAGPARGPHVIVCCEYDALPGLGHACGHNVIAAAGLGAGLALACLAPRVGGKVTVLGTPAEERGGGKVVLGRRGAFADADAAMLVHPSAYEATLPHLNAVSTLEVTMVGRASHASMYPERGTNALDAVVLGYLGVAALRQHLPATDRVHGIITDGGQAPNVVPARATGCFLVRSASAERLGDVRRRVVSCFRAGAEATGARLEARPVGPSYVEMWHNLPLAAAFEANARSLGRRPLAPTELPETMAGSTDMGNASRLVPAIHPMLAISPPELVPHSPGFTARAASPAADRAVVDGAKAMAMTALDVWLRPDLRAEARAALGERLAPASANSLAPGNRLRRSGQPAPLTLP